RLSTVRAGFPDRARRGGDRSVALAPPADAGVVDALERLVDSVLAAVLVHRPPALLERSVVVDDEVAPWRQARIQALETGPRRLVRVPVEADQRPAPAGERGHRRVEEPLHELDAVVEPEASEVAP